MKGPFKGSLWWGSVGVVWALENRDAESTGIGSRSNGNSGLGGSTKTGGKGVESG